MDSLERFVSAQARDYGTALAEIRSGHKRSHWMWYIRGIEEAKRFIAHPVLGRNLREISGALLELDTNDPVAVMGWPDNLKLCSCMTLFEAAAPDEPVFGAVLDKFYGGERDSLTLEKLR